MNKATTGVRIILGLIFFIFGLNGFLQFIPQPPLAEPALGFMMGLMKASYFFPVLKGTEVICGLMLLSGRFVPLALVILSPIVIQIFLFHTILAPDGFIMGLAILIMQAFLGFAYRDRFEKVLQK